MPYIYFMKEAFDYCVSILKEIAQFFNITYEEANIWIFVIAEPLVFLIMLAYIIYLRRKLRQRK